MPAKMIQLEEMLEAFPLQARQDAAAVLSAERYAAMDPIAKAALAGYFTQFYGVAPSDEQLPAFLYNMMLGNVVEPNGSFKRVVEACQVVLYAELCQPDEAYLSQQRGGVYDSSLGDFAVDVSDSRNWGGRGMHASTHRMRVFRLVHSEGDTSERDIGEYYLRDFADDWQEQQPSFLEKVNRAP